jgi:adenylate kinase
MRQICVILFGAPGSGKGTQAKLLRESLGVAHISTGDMLRERAAKGDDLGRLAEKIMKSGALVPDEMVNRMVEERIAQPDCAAGFMLDGYPRTVNQAKLLLTLLRPREIDPWVVNLKVDYNVIISRISGRRECPQCGTIYHVSSEGAVCAKDGSVLTGRADDRAEVVEERLRAFEQQTTPVLEFLRSAGNAVYDVDAQGAPESIARSIVAWIGTQRVGAGD